MAVHEGKGNMTTSHLAPHRRGLRLECGHVGHPIHEHDHVLDAAECLEAPGLLVVVPRHVHRLREDDVLRLQRRQINQKKRRWLVKAHMQEYDRKYSQVQIWPIHTYLSGCSVVHTCVEQCGLSVTRDRNTREQQDNTPTPKLHKEKPTKQESRVTC